MKGMRWKVFLAAGLAIVLTFAGVGFSALSESAQVAGDIMSAINGRTGQDGETGNTDSASNAPEVIQVGFYRYTAENGGAVLRGWVGSETDVTVPETLDDLPVVCVGENAFRGNAVIVSVTLPEGITRIEAGAFAECSALRAVTLPESLTFIADDAFARSDAVILICAADGYAQSYARVSGINALAVDAVSLPGDSAGTPVPLFAPGETFTEDDFECVVTDDGTVTITGYRGSEQTLAIPANLGGCAVTGIGEEAFFMNARLQEVILPEGVLEIQSAAFMGCRQLTGISLPASLSSVASDAFMGCPSLVITAPAGSWAEAYAQSAGIAQG